MKTYNEIILSEGDTLNKEFELLTTAKQTDSRYGNFEYSKEDLELMAKNFNEDVVGTEIPVDLNHDPEHIAYAWIKPKSMEVKESTKLAGHYSLYAKLYKFTPEGENLVKTGAVRYFSLQIQHKFEKFVDTGKKMFKNVIRALALTNMPVIKDMAPTLSENLIDNHNNMELQEKLDEVNKTLSEKEKALVEKERVLAEKEAEMKSLSEKLEAIEREKREAFLSESLEKLSLSEDQKIGFKGGEKENIANFVKTLSEDQAKAYFELHQGIITSATLSEEGEAGELEGEEDANEKANELATKLSKEEGIAFSEALNRVLDKNPELAKNIY